MAGLKVNLALTPDGKGKMELEHGPVVPLAGTNDDAGVAPYQMLLGALGYCLYWTLHDVMVKQRIDFGKVDVEISGEKKTEGITHLDWAKVHMVIEATEENADKVLKAVELAQKHCSIFYTLQHVAKIEVTHSLR